MATLIIKDGPRAGGRIELSDGCTRVIGRTQGDEVIDDVEISRRHATIALAADTVTITDEGSRNGTWVNGHRISGPRVLTAGDEIKLGATTMVLEHRQPPTSDFGALRADALPIRSGRIASRRIGPLVFSVTVTLATAIALMWYFATR